MVGRQNKRSKTEARPQNQCSGRACLTLGSICFFFFIQQVLTEYPFHEPDIHQEIKHTKVDVFLSSHSSGRDRP